VKKIIILLLVLVGIALAACTNGTLAEPEPSAMEIDVAAVKAAISGNWEIA